MRRINLLVSVLIGFIGTIVYFITIPTVDEDALVNVVVEAGDEKVLEDIYFDGYIADYSDFYVTTDEVYTTEGLPYLERMDAPYEMDLQILHQSYPEFIETFSNNHGIFSYNLVYTKDFLTTAHFGVQEGNYQIETESFLMSILNKETNEIQTDIIDRSNEINGDSVDIIGLYETYPTVKALLSVNTWPDQTGEETSRITIGEYNFETKVYSEEKLLEENGHFYGESISQNADTTLVDYYSMLNNEGSVYLFDYENEYFTRLERDENIFLLDEENKLFALSNVENGTVLQTYDMLDGGGLEVVDEVPLAIDFVPTLNQTESPFVEAELIGDYLYIVQSIENYEPTGQVMPATMQVFNRTTGESVMSGYIEFDEKNEVIASSGVIHTIGQISDF